MTMNRKKTIKDEIAKVSETILTKRLKGIVEKSAETGHPYLQQFIKKGKYFDNLAFLSAYYLNPSSDADTLIQAFPGVAKIHLICFYLINEDLEHLLNQIVDDKSRVDQKLQAEIQELNTYLTFLHSQLGERYLSKSVASAEYELVDYIGNEIDLNHYDKIRSSRFHVVMNIMAHLSTLENPRDKITYLEDQIKNNKKLREHHAGIGGLTKKITQQETTVIEKLRNLEAAIAMRMSEEDNKTSTESRSTDSSSDDQSTFDFGEEINSKPVKLAVDLSVSAEEGSNPVPKKSLIDTDDYLLDIQDLTAELEKIKRTSNLDLSAIGDLQQHIETAPKAAPKESKHQSSLQKYLDILEQRVTDRIYDHFIDIIDERAHSSNDSSENTSKLQKGLKIIEILKQKLTAAELSLNVEEQAHIKNHLGELKQKLYGLGVDISEPIEIEPLNVNAQKYSVTKPARPTEHKVVINEPAARAQQLVVTFPTPKTDAIFDSIYTLKKTYTQLRRSTHNKEIDDLILCAMQIRNDFKTYPTDEIKATALIELLENAYKSQQGSHNYNDFVDLINKNQGSYHYPRLLAHIIREANEGDGIHQNVIFSAIKTPIIYDAIRPIKKDAAYYQAKKYLVDDTKRNRDPQNNAPLIPDIKPRTIYLVSRGYDVLSDTASIKRQWPELARLLTDEQIQEFLKVDVNMQTDFGKIIKNAVNNQTAIKGFTLKTVDPTYLEVDAKETRQKLLEIRKQIDRVKKYPRIASIKQTITADELENKFTNIADALEIPDYNKAVDALFDLGKTFEKIIPLLGKGKKLATAKETYDLTSADVSELLSLSFPELVKKYDDRVLMNAAVLEEAINSLIGRLAGQDDLRKNEIFRANFCKKMYQIFTSVTNSVTGKDNPAIDANEKTINLSADHLAADKTFQENVTDAHDINQLIPLLKSDEHPYGNEPEEIINAADTEIILLFGKLNIAATVVSKDSPDGRKLNKLKIQLENIGYRQDISDDEKLFLMTKAIAQAFKHEEDDCTKGIFGKTHDQFIKMLNSKPNENHLARTLALTLNDTLSRNPLLFLRFTTDKNLSKIAYTVGKFNVPNQLAYLRLLLPNSDLKTELEETISNLQELGLDDHQIYAINNFENRNLRGGVIPNVAAVLGKSHNADEARINAYAIKLNDIVEALSQSDKESEEQKPEV